MPVFKILLTFSQESVFEADVLVEAADADAAFQRALDTSGGLEWRLTGTAPLTEVEDIHTDEITDPEELARLRMEFVLDHAP